MLTCLDLTFDKIETYILHSFIIIMSIKLSLNLCDSNYDILDSKQFCTHIFQCNKTKINMNTNN